jgi:TolA-binding protein
MSENTEATGGAEARIRQLVEQVKALQGRVAELEPAAAEVQSYRAQVEELKGATKAEREALRIEREIYAAGITDAEGIEYVQHAYSKLKADERPALGEWLGNKDALPRAVRAYLPEAAAPQAAPVVDTRTKLPASSATALPSPSPGATAFSPERIMSMSPSEFKANLDAIKAARGAP